MRKKISFIEKLIKVSDYQGSEAALAEKCGMSKQLFSHHKKNFTAIQKHYLPSLLKALNLTQAEAGKALFEWSNS